MSSNTTPLVFILLSALFSIFGAVTAQVSPKPEEVADRIALDGDCCVSLVEMNARVKGEKQFTSRWRGLRYLFLSEDEKVVFDSNPEKYAVAYGGLDIVGTYRLDGPLADTEKIYGTGRHTHRFEDRTYDFANEKNLRLFMRNERDYVFRAKNALYRQAEAKRGKNLSELYPEK